MNIQRFLHIQPYSLKKTDKEKLLTKYLAYLTQHHYASCLFYRKMMDSIGFNPEKKCHYSHLPFLPVQLFKMLELSSVQKDKIVKTISSSGTSRQKKSIIFLDKENAADQRKVLAKIVASFIGHKRMPMIIIDSGSSVKNKDHISANSAGIIGFSLYGYKHIYALNEKMELNIEQLKSFIEQYKGERILIYGFTFKVYQYFYKVLAKTSIKLDLSNAVLIHGGGWKKLESLSISPKDFRKKLHDVCGIRYVNDYYGMVEQTGSIFMECENGHYHTSVFSDIIIRRAKDFSITDKGEEGIIQVLSVLPKSYPGHSLLTDDKGVLLGEDNCPCGRLGKYFTITGRIENADLRGCSNTYEEKFR